MNAATHSERGQVLVLAALFMVVLLVSAALAIDYASWLTARRDFQSVVDAASLAAAAELPAPGTGSASATERDAAAAEALVYLNDHLGWGHDRAWASAQVAATPSARNNTAPLVVSTGSGTYCVWVWTPTPAAAVTTTPAAGSQACLRNPGGILYAPANYPTDGRKVFVAISSPRASYFANIAGIHDEVVSAFAVAGGSHLNYAVIALKPRLRTPDTNLGITITGNNSSLIVPNGDVGGNYSLAWGGTGSSVVFTAGENQVVDLEEPASIAGNGSVINGTVHQLEDYPIPDPLYGTPPSCTAALTSACWDAWPPTSPVTATLKGVYPACEQPNKINNHILDLGCVAPAVLAAGYTIYPGKYQEINIPAGSNITLSTSCLSTDNACLDPNGDGNTADQRGGVYYLTTLGSTGSASGSGLRMNGTPGKPTVLQGCGVLMIFDPDESGGSNVQMNVGGAGNTIQINTPTISSGCSMHYSPGNPTGTTNYLWYGYNAADFTNPISVWVRPNRNGYDMTGTNNGSNVITLGAGSTIQENGVIYAPEDNTIVSGGPAGSGVGQIVAWTITYTGNSTINETFQGPAKLRTRLYQ